MAWRYLLVVLIVPALLSAEKRITSAETALHDANNTTTLESHQAPSFQESIKSFNSCNETQIERVHNMSKEETKCLKTFLLSQANEGVETSCNSIESVDKSITMVLNASAKCLEEKRTLKIIAAGKTFLNFLNFSMEGDILKEKVHKGFVECINNTRYDTRECVLNATGKEKYNAVLELIDLRSLELSSKGCSQSKRVQSCVEKTLKGEASCNNTAIVNYVDSLFNFTLKNCPELPLQDTVSAKMHPGAIAAIVILAIVIILCVGAVIKKRVKRRAHLNSVIYNNGTNVDKHTRINVP